LRETSRSLRFGSFVLDEARGDLWRDGAPVEIQATPLRLLRYLAEHPGDLLSRDELLEHVWGGVVVSDNAIATALKQVRLILDDRDRAPPWIETLRGRGIRFNAAVEPVAGEPDTAASSREGSTAGSPTTTGTRARTGRAALRALGIAAASLAATAAVLAVAVWLAWPAPLGLLLDAAGVTGPPIDPPAPARPSIAVLPFVNLSDDAAQEYFSDGITEDLTTDLSRNPTLFVISRNSAFSYKGRPVDIRQVGRELGVRYVVEGSVRRADDRVRVTAQLIDATTGGHLYSERYDRELRDIFALQSEIAERLTTTLRSEIHDVEMREEWSRGTGSVLAYDAYLEGWSHLLRFRLQSVTEDARRLAARTIELDPGYAMGYLLMGATYSMEFQLAWSDDRTLLDRAEALTRQARELDPLSELGNEGLEGIARERGRPDEALVFADRAVAAHPNSSVAHLARTDALINLERPLAAIESLRTALRLDPRGLTVTAAVYAWVNATAGRREKAVEFFEQARRDNPDLVIPRANLAAWYEANGNHEEARILTGEILGVVPSFTAERGARHVSPQLCDGARELLARAGLPESALPPATPGS
jgi:TolB-like protein/DNA-binding winged helix-turn-helix (wHTH) protein